jgi:hypothetical protein
LARCVCRLSGQGLYAVQKRSEDGTKIVLDIRDVKGLASAYLDPVPIIVV